jgi:hypothetical protein
LLPAVKELACHIRVVQFQGQLEIRPAFSSGSIQIGGGAAQVFPT